jgi:SAM-dependent methyltransferase
MDTLPDLARLAAASTATFVAWVLWRMRSDHDDDDQVYFACFKPSASPVATPHAFVKILNRVPPGSRVLDIGIGSGTYLEHDTVREVVRARKLVIDGVDISTPNVAICQQRIDKHKLGDCFTVIVQDARTLARDGKYDALLWMESFPCMSKPLFIDIYGNVQRLLKPSGVNYLYHNLGDPEKMSGPMIALARLFKPVIRVFVGIDFGRLTTKPEMWECLEQAAPKAAKKLTHEILLSCSSSEANIDFSGVSNKFFRFWCLIFKIGMKVADYRMEQHLIVVPKA